MKCFCSLLILIVVIYSFTACSTIEEVKTTRSTDDPMLEEYYLNIEGTENRLIGLMTGYFSCYSVRKKGLWVVNGGKDSIVMHACQLGDPARDGYWVYQEIVMSSLTEAPLVQSLMKIEKHTHDSLTIRNYRIKEKEKFEGIYKKKNRDFDPKSIVETDCPRTCLKLDQTHFECRSYNCASTDKRKQKETWTDASYRYQPQKIRQETMAFFDKENKDTSNISNHTILYFKRMPPKSGK